MRLFVAVALLSGAARAQDSAVVKACDRPSNSKVQAAFYGQLATIPMVQMTQVGPEYMHAVLEAVRQSWHPGPLSLAVYEMSRHQARLSGATTVVFSLTDGGAVRDLGLASSSLSPEFDRAVYAAVRRADSAQLFVPLPEHGPKRVTFYLTVFLDRYPDTTSAHPSKPGLIVPLLTTVLPAWDGDVSLPGPAFGGPTYPEYARSANVEDALRVRFVIDEKGHVGASSIWFEAGTYQEFAKSIQAWLPHAHYAPGHIGKCAVKVLVEQPFTYRLKS